MFYKVITILFMLIIIAAFSIPPILTSAGADETPMQREFPIDFEVVHNYDFDIVGPQGNPCTGWVAGPIKRGFSTELEMGLVNHGEAITVQILAPGTFTSVEPNTVFLDIGSSASFTCRIEVPLNASLGPEQRSLGFWVQSQE